MLGKRSRPVLQTFCKFSVPDGEDSDQKALSPQALSSKHPFPPQHVTVFGFNIPQENKPSDICESPRSVLDVPSEKHPQGRFFRSCVRAIPLQNRGSQGVGLAIIVELHAEEKGDNGSLPHAGDEVSVGEQTHHPSVSTSACRQSHHHHQQSQPIAIAVNCRSQDCSSTYKVSKYVESLEVEDDNDDDDSSSVESVLDMEFFGLDCTPPWQDFLIHNKASNNADNEKDMIIRPSIFTVASIPSSYGSFGIQPVSFLDACALCQRAFAPGKDIFMYRGDQAFCSMECRGERIKRDEHKKKLITMNA